MLPAIRTSHADQIGVGPEISIEPGSWWRVAEEDHKLLSRDWWDGGALPEHGLILLLEEVRIIDGEIHTLILKPHPYWSHWSGEVRMLLDEFLRVMAPCPEGADLRAREQEALMQSINAIAQDMSNVPSAELLLSDASAPKEESAPPAELEPVAAVKLPAALLPSGDILAAQAKLEREIAVQKARTDWIMTQSRKMDDRMKVVGRFQEERVAATTASISKQMDEAKGLLKNVHTMRLFLGEGVKIYPVIDGESAPASEPLHLMQRMLYLDEEIYVERMLKEGFTHDDLAALPELLACDPSLVERMLPMPRCVAIARVRRKDRPWGSVPQSIAAALQRMAESLDDKRIVVLVRDGRRVNLVIADEDTSKAERLFPSHQEIEAIFKERPRYDRDRASDGPRTITPFDLEYSDKRAKHDDRALFYRRFLIMFWGLQEREELFGPFIPAGSNWLLETTHSTYFRFVHDEEEVLGDGRMPVQQWIGKQNLLIRPGSVVAIQPGLAINEDSAPTAYKPSPIRAYEQERVRFPEKDLELLVAARRKDETIVSVAVSNRSYESDRKRVSKLPVILRGENQNVATHGFLCLDRVRSADLRYYINSRIHRESYLRWLALFRFALIEVEAREVWEAEALASVRKADSAIPNAPIETAMRMFGEARGLTRDPLTQRDIRRILASARKLAALDAAAIPGKNEGAYVDLDGRVTSIVRMEDPLVDQLKAPLRLAVTYQRKHGRWEECGRRVVPFGAPAPLGSEVLIDGPTPIEVRDGWSGARRGIHSPADWSVLSHLRSEEHAKVVDAFIEEWENNPRPLLEAHFAESLERNLKSHAKLVITFNPEIDLGLMAIIGDTVYAPSVLVRLAVDPVQAALRSGNDDILEAYVHAIYKRKEEIMRRYRAATDRPIFSLLGVSMRDTRLLTADVKPGSRIQDQDGWRGDNLSIKEVSCKGEVLTMPRTLASAAVQASIGIPWTGELNHSKFEVLRKAAVEAFWIGPEKVPELAATFLAT